MYKYLNVQTFNRQINISHDVSKQVPIDSSLPEIKIFMRDEGVAVLYISEFCILTKLLYIVTNYFITKVKL